jgi:hypothetical protein
MCAASATSTKPINLKDHTVESVTINPMYTKNESGSINKTAALPAKTIEPMTITRREYRYLELRMPQL